LIESEWYKKRWGDRFELTSDQNTKSAFTNSKGGERLITSVGAGITGLGGSIILADDPNSAGEAFSEAAIQSTIDWWSQSMSTRLNDMATGAYVIIQQRLAEDDLTGYILEKNNGEWCHLMLPMRYEPERSYVTTIGWKDPRTVPGELLWPERFSEQAVVELERSLGPMIANGQLQQRPEPAGGGIIPRDYWKLWERDTFPQMDFIMASLDTAYTEKTSNDFSALTVWGVFSGERSLIDTPNRVIDKRGESQMMYRDNAMYEASTAPKVMMMFAWKERFELHKLVEKVADTCTKLKVDLLLIESKAAGHSVAQEVRRLYANERFGVQLFDPKSQDKLSRLFSIQHLFAEGIVYAPDRKWADMVITEVAQFPYGKHDDLTDTVSQAMRHMRDNGLIARAPERAAELEELKRYRGHQEPLYPV
jgi:predicted phage terminase large subunit-like protein